MKSENYTPKITVRPRNGCMAVWVTMPDGEEWNIWDLHESHITYDVLGAIRSAFERGFEAHRLLIQRTQSSVTVEAKYTCPS